VQSPVLQGEPLAGPIGSILEGREKEGARVANDSSEREGLKSKKRKTLPLDLRRCDYRWCANPCWSRNESTNPHLPDEMRKPREVGEE